jgi:hypothetical protein
VFELPDDNDYSERRFEGCEHACACEFSLNKMLELFANSPAAVCFPRLSKNRWETNEHHSVSFLKMTMIMLKSVSRDAKMNVFAIFILLNDSNMIEMRSLTILQLHGSKNSPDMGKCATTSDSRRRLIQVSRFAGACYFKVPRLS